MKKNIENCMIFVKFFLIRITTCSSVSYEDFGTTETRFLEEILNKSFTIALPLQKLNLSLPSQKNLEGSKK